MNAIIVRLNLAGILSLILAAALLPPMAKADDSSPPPTPATQPATSQPAVTSTRPTPEAAKSPRRVVIDVRSGGTDGKGVVYVIDGKECKDIDALAKALRARAKSSDAVVIRPWGMVEWEHVVAAFNIAVKLEYKKIGFAGH